MEQTDNSQRGGRNWIKEREGTSQRTYIHITHRHRQQCGDGQREGGHKVGEEVAKRGKNGDTSNSVNNKKRKKIR